MNEGQLDLTRRAVEPFPHEYIGCIPFSRDITSTEPIFGRDYIPYGSTLFTNIAMDRGWSGLCFDLSKFNYRTSVENRQDMLNSDGKILSASDMVNYLQTIDAEAKFFTRPSEDLKHYSGTVMSSEEIVEMLESMMGAVGGGSYYLNPKTEIVVSKPKEISAEWRWFIVDRKIVSGAMYRAHGQLRKLEELDPKVITEAQAMADVWLPHDCCVMDTALVDDKLYVVEFNCINSSGFYGHDVDKIFRELWKYFEGK